MLPSFKPGQTLKASDLQTLADAIADLQARVQEQTLSLSDDFEVERTPSGTCLSLIGGHWRGNAVSQKRTRLPFEIYIKTNEAGRQSIFCDGNVLKQNYAVEETDINYKGFSQFGISQSQLVPAEFTGTYVVYVRYNQIGATGIGLLIEEKETAPDETVFIGRVKFKNGVPAIEQIWTGGISFVSVEPHQVSITWSNCPCYDCNESQE